MLDYNFQTEGKTIVADFPEVVRGKTFLITGPSEGGLGAETAITLAAGSPARLLLVGRSKDKIQPVIDAIRSAAPTHIDIQFISAQFDSLLSLREAAQQILSDKSITKIDGMVNNAGIMGWPTFETTEDGIEMHLGINHVSHFLLTNLLLPLLLAAGKSRVVNITSYGHLFSPLRFEDPSFGGGEHYHPWKAYAASKTANILFAVGLNENFGSNGLQAFAVNPGSIGTNLGRYINPESLKLGLEIHQENNFSRPEHKTLQQGISTGVRALLDATLSTEDGVYLTDGVQSQNAKDLASYAVSQANAKRCWQVTQALINDKLSS